MERLRDVIKMKLRIYSLAKLSDKKQKVFYIMILFILLFVTRHIDFTILSSLGNAEHFHLNKLANYQSNHSEIYYTAIGFSYYESAKEKLLLLVEQRKEKIIVLNFFDLLCPTRYLIFNRGDNEIVSIPWTWSGNRNGIEACRGITEINLFKFDYISIISNCTKKGYFLPIIGSFIPFLIDMYEVEKNAKDKNTFDLSFNIKTHYFDSSIFIKQIYLFYFYFPLVIIMILLRKYNIHLSFYYFIIMPMLSTPKYFMFYAPSLSLLELDYEISISLIIIVLIITISFGIFFIKNIRHGLKMIKEKKLELKEKFIILFFLLLPLFLRF